MKLSIKNFRNLENQEIEWSKIHIQGKNWSGKSNVLRAIERVLFGTIYGRKQGITPVMNGAAHCKVELTLGETEYMRVDSQTTAYVNAAIRPIMFCNLLDQEYPYIKKVLADVLIQDKAKPLFGSLRAGSIDTSITNVKTTRTNTNKEFLKIKNRIDFLNEELAKNEHITGENMEQMEEQYANKKLELDKYTTQDGATLKWLEEWLKSLNSLKNEKEKLLQEYKLNLNRLLIQANKLVEEWKRLKENKCPTCGGAFTDEALLDKTRISYHDTTKAIEELRVTISSIEQTLVKVNTEITEAESKKLEVLSSSSESIVSQWTLEREVNSLFQLLADYWAKLKQKTEWEDELLKLVDQLIKLEQAEVFQVNDKISPKWELNQLLQEAIHEKFPGLTFNIIEETEYGDFKSTMAVYYNDVEYKELSRSEKMYINVLLSTTLMSLKPEWHYPLLLDDTEMFSKNHIEKLEALLSQSAVEYVLTKVCNCAFSFNVKE